MTEQEGEVPGAGVPPSAAGPVPSFLPADLASAASPAPRVPGSTREGFQRFPTGMMDLPAGAAVARADELSSGVPTWAGPAGSPATPAPYRGVTGWGLVFAIVGLLASFVVGWGFPISLVGLVTGAIALRRPAESRPLAGWSIALGITGLVYSAGWLLFAALSADFFA